MAWIQLKDTNSATLTGLDQRKGVYRVRLKDTPITRLCDIDHEGVLYIGCSKSRILKERFRDMQNEFKRHTIGFKLQVQAIRQKVHPNMLIEYMYDDNPYEKEQELITHYRNRFGEEPPFNVQLMILNNKNTNLDFVK